MKKALPWILGIVVLALVIYIYCLKTKPEAEPKVIDESGGFNTAATSDVMDTATEAQDQPQVVK